MKSAIVRRSHDSLDDDSPAEEALEQGTLAFDSAPKEFGTYLNCLYIIKIYLYYINIFIKPGKDFQGPLDHRMDQEF